MLSKFTFFCSAQDRTIEAVRYRTVVRLKCGLHLFFGFQAIVFLFILFCDFWVWI